MLLRYDFDPVQSRRLLDSVLALARREESVRRPRREARVPLALGVEPGGLRGVTTAIDNISRRGCRLDLRGGRVPEIHVGDRLRMALSGRGRGPKVDLTLEVRWVRSTRTKKGRRLLIGAAFVELGAEARTRLHSILKLQDLRPTIRLRRVAPTRQSR